jgi:hypothetical protein
MNQITLILTIGALVFGLTLLGAFSQKPKSKIKVSPNMEIQSFHITQFQRESSRDSNAQLDHIFYKDGILHFQDEWQGYHPGGGGGKMPDMQYYMTDEALTKIYEFLKENKLIESQTSTPAAKDSKPPSPIEREESRSYGIRINLELKDGKEIKHEFSYQTSGPRVEELENNPLNKKLTELFKLLESLRYRGIGNSIKALESRQKTEKERADETHERLYGHKVGEKPTELQRFRFTMKQEELGKKSYSSSNYVYPVYAISLDYQTLRVTYYSSGGAKENTDTFYENLPKEMIDKILGLLVEYNFYGKERNHHNLGGKGIKNGDQKITFEIEINFGSRWNQRTKYEIIYYKDRDMEQPTKENMALLQNANALNKALLEFVSSSELEKYKKKK